MSRDEEEIRTFRQFVAEAGMAVLPASIEKRSPPEPDILCQLADGTHIAFELTEVCVPANAAFTSSAWERARIIEECYRTLPNQIKMQLDARFGQSALSFRFQSGSTLRQVRGIIPRIFRELSAHAENPNFFDAFSAPVKKVLDSIWLRGRSYETPGPWFNLNGSFSPDDIVVDCVMAKLYKKYTTPHSIELLAHFGHFAFSSKEWQEPLRELLDRRGTRPFRRIWVLGWHGLEFVYPPLVDAGPKSGPIVSTDSAEF
jgi:hypothetical protein